MTKSLDLTPNSSVKSSTTATSIESEIRDSYYFPGCKKDANCNCEICIASINATLDLMPQSIQRSSLNKFSAPKPTLPRSPISFNPSTPKSRTDQLAEVSAFPPLNLTATMDFHEKMKRKKEELGVGVFVFRFLLVLSLVLAAEYGFSWMVSEVFPPALSVDRVRNLGQRSFFLDDLNERVSFLKKEIWSLVDKDLPNCSYVNSMWQINQDGLLLNSRKVLYKSITEEVSIWGWPLQTAGLLTAEFSSRSFTVLSGRVTEWRNGEVGYLIHKPSSSWVQDKWSASPVQLDPNTWILEYQKRSIMENARLISSALQFLKFRLGREVRKMQQEFWLLFAFGSQNTDSTVWSIKIPT